MINTIAKILNTTRQSYYNWKETKPVILLLERYFKKEELEEFLESNKIKKFELIKNLSVEELESKLSNIGNYDRDNRTKEIITLLKKYTESELSQTLRYCMGIYDINNNREYNKYTFIEKLKNLLKDAAHENELYDNKFNPLIRSLNDKLGFDFNVNDIPILLHILSKFKVYNTLYEFDEDN